MTNINTAKRAVSADYLYYADSDSKLIRIDLENETALTLATDYLIESLTVSTDDEVLFSGRDQTGSSILIRISKDLAVSEIDTSGDVIKQITVIR